MKITLEFAYDEALARAIAIANGGRGEAGPQEIREWAKDTLAAASDALVETIRAQMEEQKP